MKIGWRKTPAKIQIKEFSKSYINLILETTIEMNRLQKASIFWEEMKDWMNKVTTKDKRKTLYDYGIDFL